MLGRRRSQLDPMSSLLSQVHSGGPRWGRSTLSYLKGLRRALLLTLKPHLCEHSSPQTVAECVSAGDPALGLSWAACGQATSVARTWGSAPARWPWATPARYPGQLDPDLDSPAVFGISHLDSHSRSWWLPCHLCCFCARPHFFACFPFSPGSSPLQELLLKLETL